MDKKKNNHKNSYLYYTVFVKFSENAFIFIFMKINGPSLAHCLMDKLQLMNVMESQCRLMASHFEFKLDF